MIEIFGVEYEEVIGSEITLPDGKIVIHHEDEKYKIIQTKTGYLFDVADDLQGSGYMYGLTDIVRDDVTIEDENVSQGIETAEIDSSGLASSEYVN